MRKQRKSILLTLMLTIILSIFTPVQIFATEFSTAQEEEFEKLKESIFKNAEKEIQDATTIPESDKQCLITTKTTTGGNVVFVNGETKYAEGTSADFYIQEEDGYVLTSLTAYDTITKEERPISVLNKGENTYTVGANKNGITIEAEFQKKDAFLITYTEEGINNLSINLPESACIQDNVEFSFLCEEGLVPTNVQYSYYDTETAEKVTLYCEKLGNNRYQFTMPAADTEITAETKTCSKHSVMLKTEGDIYNTPSLSKASAYPDEIIYLFGSTKEEYHTNFTAKNNEDITYPVLFDSELKRSYIIMPDEDITIIASEEQIIDKEAYENAGDLISEETEIALEVSEETPVNHTFSLKALSISLLSDMYASTTYPDHTTTKTEGASDDSIPTVTITKNARWTDIEQGYAEIYLTEKDTPGSYIVQTYTGSDYAIAIDRSDSTMVDWTQMWFYCEDQSNLGWGAASADGTGGQYQYSPGMQNAVAQSPCLSAAHYYTLPDGTKFYLTMKTTTSDNHAVYWGYNAEDTSNTSLRCIMPYRDYPNSEEVIYIDACKDLNGNDKIDKGDEIGVRKRTFDYQIDDHHYDENNTHLGSMGTNFMVSVWALESAYVTGNINQALTNARGETCYYVTTDYTHQIPRYQAYTWSNVNCRSASRFNYEKYFADTIIKLLRAMDTSYGTTSPSRVAVWQYGNRNDYNNLIEAFGTTGTKYYARRFEKAADDSRAGVVNGYNFSTEGLVHYNGGLQNVNSTSVNLTSVTAGGGTDYAPSLNLAYMLMTQRTGDEAKRPFNIIFMTDSEEESGYHHSTDVRTLNGNTIHYNATNVANLIKAHNSCPVTLYTIGVGLGNGAGDATYLQSLSGKNSKSQVSQTYFTTVVSSRSSLVDALNGIAEAVVENAIVDEEIKTNAVNKVFEDSVSDYFDIISTSTANGTINHSGSTVTWNVTEGANTTYHATIRIKLKDEYRYLNNDTSYPTNKDTSASLGAKMTYDVRNTKNETESTGNNIQTATPILPYGTVKMLNDKADDNGKNYTVDNTYADSIRVNVSRKAVSDSTYGATIASAVATKTAGNKYQWEITRRDSNNAIPLVLYSNYEEKYDYKQTEAPVKGYVNVNSADTKVSDTEYQTVYTNKPYQATVDADKRDAMNGNVIKDAEFTVFSYKGSGDTNNIDNYNVYCVGKTGSKDRIYAVDYDTYIANPSSYDAVKLLYSATENKYVSTKNLYYDEQTNKGYFKVVETKTPSGYYGDWKAGVTPNANSTYKDKNNYDVVIDTNGSDEQHYTIKNTNDTTFRNMPVKYEISISKTGPVSTGIETDGNKTYTKYETKPKAGAMYVLRAAEDIKDVQGNVVYAKGTIIEPQDINSMSSSLIRANEQDSTFVTVSSIDFHNYNEETGFVSDNVGTIFQSEFVYTSNDPNATVVTKTKNLANHTLNTNWDKFTVSADGKTITFPDGQSTEHVFITNSNGIANIKGLWKGMYEIVEIIPPSGLLKGYGQTTYEAAGKSITRYVNSAFSVGTDVDNEYTRIVSDEVSYYNKPLHADIQLDKVDFDNGNKVKNAVFTVFAYLGIGDENDIANYGVYCYEQKTAADDEMDCDIYTVPYSVYVQDTDAYKAVQVLYNEEKDYYTNTAPLYATSINNGHFKIIETGTPEGYFGDWKEGINPNALTDYQYKNAYDMVIAQNSVRNQTFDVRNTDKAVNTYTNKGVKYEIEMEKVGDVATGTETLEDGTERVIYTELGLPGAWYVVRAAEDIYDIQGNLVYNKGELVTPTTPTTERPSLVKESEQDSSCYVYLKDLDLSEYEQRADSNHVLHIDSTIQDGISVEDLDGLETEGTYVRKTDYFEDEAYQYNDLYDEYDLDCANGIITFADGQTTDRIFVTGNDGKAIIKYLWKGSYEVTELKAPTGYVRGRSYTVDILDNDVRVERPTNSAFSIFETVTNDYTSTVTETVTYFNDRQKPNDDTPPDGYDPKDNNPSISLTKSVEEHLYRPLETAYYHVKVKNTGDCDLVNAVITDCMDNGEEVVIATIDRLAIGEEQTFDYEFIVPETDEPGTVHNNVAIVTAHSESVPEFGIPEKEVSDRDNEKIKVIDDMGVLKESDKNLYINGETITYTIYVKNNEIVYGDYVLTDEEEDYFASEDYYNHVSENNLYDDVDADMTVIAHKKSVIPEDYNPSMSYTFFSQTDLFEDPVHKMYSIKAFMQETKLKTLHNIVVTDNFLSDATLISGNIDNGTISDNAISDNTISGNSLNGIVTSGYKELGDLTYISGNIDERISYDKDGKVVIQYLKPGETAILRYTMKIGENFDGSYVDNFVEAVCAEGLKDNDEKKVYIENPEIKIIKSAREHSYNGNDVLDGVNNHVEYDVTVTNTGDCDLTDTLVRDTVLTDGTFLTDVKVYDAEGLLVEQKQDSVSENSVSDNSVNDNSVSENSITDTYPDLFTCSVSGNSVALGDLPVGYSKTITYTYDLSKEQAGKYVANIMAVDAVTTPDPDDPNKPQKPVKDTDDEVVYSSVQIGIRKLADINGVSKPIKNALLGLYAAKDITNIFGDVIIPEGTFLKQTYTDEDGFARFNLADYPIGEYLVKEIEAPNGTYRSDAILYLHTLDYRFNDDITDIYVGGVIRDQASRVKVFLYDDNTMEELADAKLLVSTDKNATLSGNSISENAVLSDDIVDVYITKVTNGEGYEIYGCIPGQTYYLIEDTARTGYVNEIVRDLSDTALHTTNEEKNIISFVVPEYTTTTINDEDNRLYTKIENSSEIKPYNLRITNDFVQGEVKIYKTGDLLDSWNIIDKVVHWFKSVFAYIKGSISDIEFTITANEDIYHPDGVTGIIYHKGDVVKENVKSITKDAIEYTDNAGLATFTEMYLGEYVITETRGREGLYITDPIAIKLEYKDQDTPIVYATESEMAIHNPKQEVTINIYKRDKDTGNLLEGAEFELYAAEDIYNDANEIITKKDELLETGIITDENGYACVESELANGYVYYLKEVKAPENYYIDKENEKIYVDTTSTQFLDKQLVYDVTVLNDRSDDKLTVLKSAPETIDVTETLRFTVDRISNDCRVPVDDFTVIDVLPADKVDIQTLYTGSFNEDVPMKVYIRTSSWKPSNTSVSNNSTEETKVNETDTKETDKASSETEDTYVFTTGERAWQNGSVGALSFVANANPTDLVKITMDDKEVPNDGYKKVATTGETSIFFQSDYLNTLSVGEHVLKFIYKNGTASTTLTINGVDSSIGSSNTGTDTTDNTDKPSVDTSSDGWILWSDNVSSGNGATLTKESLNLANNERIAQIKIEFGTVPAGFINSMEDKPYYEGPVDDLEENVEILNHISLTGTAFGKKLKDEDDTTTTTTVPDPKIVVKKSAPETASIGESIMFTIDEIRNDSTKAVNRFTLSDELPKNVNMTSLYTGTYSDELKYTVLYKTNLTSDWKVWKSDVSTTKGQTLQVSDLSLSKNEYITEFAMQYGTVPSGFCLNANDKATYHVTVGNVKEGTKLVNNIHLTAYRNKNKLTSDDTTTTTVQKNPTTKTTVKTGDNNYLYAICLMLFILSMIGLVTYSAIVAVKHVTKDSIIDNGDSMTIIPGKKFGNKSQKTLAEIMKEKSIDS